VTRADFNANKVNKVYTVNHGEIPLEASAYVLASGSFFSRGLTSTPDGINEPVVGADIVAEANRNDWYSTDVFAPQRYMEFGVATDSEFHVVKDGKPVTNLYAIGSILSGFNPIELGCGAGVAMLTAIDVANKLTDNK
ncbi:MAG: FAD-binding protein, partial [Candidatus Limisoma sp.]